jgi:hypothetical protein
VSNYIDVVCGIKETNLYMHAFLFGKQSLSFCPRNNTNSRLYRPTASTNNKIYHGSKTTNYGPTHEEEDEVYLENAKAEEYGFGFTPTTTTTTAASSSQSGGKCILG